MRQAFHLILLFMLRVGVAVIFCWRVIQLIRHRRVPLSKAADVMRAILYRRLVERTPIPSKEENSNHVD